MPLRAVRQDEQLFAEEFDDQSWAELKRTYRGSSLVMPCCGTHAVPKTSSLGSHFFAHKRRGDCATAPESEQHVYLKTLVARAARRAGWKVWTEWPGQTPEGEKWIADVYCELRTARIALEIQLSPQTRDVFAQRQDAYKRSGVRTAWLVPAGTPGRRKTAPSRSLPVFGVRFPETGGEPRVDQFELSVTEFVHALLTRRIVWEPEAVTQDLLYVEDECWNCHRAVRQIYGRSIDVYGDEAKTVPNASSVLEKLANELSNPTLHALGINGIERVENFRGNAPRFPWCNACRHCGAPQSNSYLMKRIVDPAVRKSSVAHVIEDAELGQWAYRAQDP